MRHRRAHVCLSASPQQQPNNSEHDFVTRMVGKIFGQVGLLLAAACTHARARFCSTRWGRHAAGPAPPQRVAPGPTQAAIDDPAPGGLKRMDWGSVKDLEVRAHSPIFGVGAIPHACMQAQPHAAACSLEHLQHGLQGHTEGVRSRTNATAVCAPPP